MEGETKKTVRVSVSGCSTLSRVERVNTGYTFSKFGMIVETKQGENILEKVEELVRKDVYDSGYWIIKTISFNNVIILPDRKTPRPVQLVESSSSVVSEPIIEDADEQPLKKSKTDL